MKCLVTGGAGFIGSNLSRKLCEQGHEVTVVDNLATGKLANLEGLPIKLHIANIRLISRNFEDEFDVIFHLAALARIQPSFKNPLGTYDTNSSGTVSVLEYARLHEGTKVVYAGSSTFYHYVHSSPYCYTKWLGEQHCQLYSEIYGVPTAVARFFNVYGPNQLEEGEFSTVIGIFEKQKREGKPLTVTGDGLKRRDFTHVFDIADGLIAIASASAGNDEVWGNTFNFGTGKNYSILEVAQMFQAPIMHIPERRNEAQTTLADISVSRRVLGYEPKYVLEEYIKNYIGS